MVSKRELQRHNICPIIKAKRHFTTISAVRVFSALHFDFISETTFSCVPRYQLPRVNNSPEIQRRLAGRVGRSRPPQHTTPSRWTHAISSESRYFPHHPTASERHPRTGEEKKFQTCRRLPLAPTFHATQVCPHAPIGSYLRGKTRAASGDKLHKPNQFHPATLSFFLYFPPILRGEKKGVKGLEKASVGEGFGG